MPREYDLAIARLEGTEIGLRDAELPTVADNIAKSIAAIQAHVAALEAARDELVKALGAAENELSVMALHLGPCDHAVGDCQCDLVAAIDAVRAALAKAKQP